MMSPVTNNINSVIPANTLKGTSAGIQNPKEVFS